MYSVNEVILIEVYADDRSVNTRFVGIVSPVYYENSDLRGSMKTEKFRDMWNATAMAQTPFEDVWIVESDDMVRPNWKIIEYLSFLHSSREKALFRFFKGIYNGQEGMMDALLYWKLSTPEAKTILRWLENPFFF